MQGLYTIDTPQVPCIVLPLLLKEVMYNRSENMSSLFQAIEL